MRSKKTGGAVAPPSAGQPGEQITVTLKYTDDRKPVISGLRRISRPGRRTYVDHDHIPRVQGGMGTAIISTSSGVMTGLKTGGVNPTYPPIARAARISGTVVLQATISKTGTIENLRVISGPPMLTQSALEAVKTWRYKPYQLNGEPVEVETTVNVVFNLGG